METIQKIHGVPKIIVSDKDLIFTGNFWTELFSCLGTQLAQNSSYHPQSDGKTDIVNKCLEVYLRCFASNKHTVIASFFSPHATCSEGLFHFPMQTRSPLLHFPEPKNHNFPHIHSLQVRKHVYM
jgi:hypothetical protein